MAFPSAWSPAVQNLATLASWFDDTRACTCSRVVLLRVIMLMLHRCCPSTSDIKFDPQESARICVCASSCCTLLWCTSRRVMVHKGSLMFRINESHHCWFLSVTISFFNIWVSPLFSLSYIRDLSSNRPGGLYNFYNCSFFKNQNQDLT